MPDLRRDPKGRHIRESEALIDWLPTLLTFGGVTAIPKMLETAARWCEESLPRSNQLAGKTWLRQAAILRETIKRLEEVT